MAIVIRDQHLEDQIDRERVRRGDSTMAKTAADLLREKLTEMEMGRRAPKSNELSETNAPA